MRWVMSKGRRLIYLLSACLLSSFSKEHHEDYFTIEAIVCDVYDRAAKISSTLPQLEPVIEVDASDREGSSDATTGSD